MSNNPKERCGALKVPLHLLPPQVMAEVAIGMAEGAEKYGYYNWRDTHVVQSTYYGANLRHMFAWFDGENIDPDSPNGLHHVTKAICSLIVLRDAMLQGNTTDDRPRPANHTFNYWNDIYQMQPPTVTSPVSNGGTRPPDNETSTWEYQGCGTVLRSGPGKN